jgi:hypothetical protein
MADTPKMIAVSVGDVTRGVLDRLSEREDQLRELLSYAETKGEDCQNEPGWSGYADMATKLRAILDGE